jgi:hypothetical protein
MLPLRLAGVNMADEASSTFGGGVKNYLGALGFLLPMVGLEELVRHFVDTEHPSLPWKISAILIAAGLPLFVLPWMWNLIWRKSEKKLEGKPQALEYLNDRDTDLNGAIISAAWRSAYGRWFAAQILVSGGVPIQPRYLIHTMAGQVFNRMQDGDIEVRGRKPGQLDYTPIPRTHWRSSAFYVIEHPLSLWRVILAPRGTSQIAPDGSIASNDHPPSAERTAQLRDYDSLIVDAYQFEKAFPRNDPIADKQRRRFLWRARCRRLDKNEIKRLSRS